MIIEIAGVSTQNKGAELMLIAAAEHMRSRGLLDRALQGDSWCRARLSGSPPTIAVDPWFGSYEDRAQYGLRTVLRGERWRRSPRVAWRLARSAALTRLMPADWQRTYGLVREVDVEAVLDASGFAFGDQLGPQRIERFAADVRRWKRHGKKVVLLPQALGPFEQRRIRQAFAEVVSARHGADLVYARDRASFEYAREVAEEQGTAESVRMAPDFTNLVEAASAGRTTEGRLAGRACVVPNHRIVEKTNVTEAGRYLPLLAKCLLELARRGLEPFLLLHDARVDESLIEPLWREAGGAYEVVRESDPRRLKGILGHSHVVVGSRFHALVGALCQAVPCLAVGWSHKYRMLFEDYGCGRCVMPLNISPADLAEQITGVTEEQYRSLLVDGLRRYGEKHVQQVRAMWAEVDELLGLSPQNDAAPIDPEGTHSPSEDAPPDPREEMLWNSDRAGKEDLVARKHQT